jgi:hypothetical protein
MTLQTIPQIAVLEQRVDYFDRNHGIFDTFWGFWKLGFNTLLCIGAVFVIHSSFSLVTNTNILLPCALVIYVDNLLNNAKLPRNFEFFL